MVNACGHICVESWVQVRKNELLNAQVLVLVVELLFLHGLCSPPIFVHVLPCFPHLDFFVFSVAVCPLIFQRVPCIVRHVVHESILMSFLREKVLLFDHDFLKVRHQEVESLPQSWVERVLELNFARILVSRANIAVLSYCRPHLVVHVSCLGIADPAMDTSSS